MNIRVCEACGEECAAQTTMAALALPPKPSMGTFIASILGRSAAADHELHLLCPQCGAALLAFIRGVGRSLRDVVAS